MQLCSWGDSGSLGSLSIGHISPRKLELLERRFAGASNPARTDSGGSRDRQPQHSTQDSPVEDMIAEHPVVAETAHAVQHHGTDEEPIYIPDTQEEAMLPAVLRVPVQPTAAASDKRSPTPPAAEVPMSASKRRKTGKPQHRPVESAAAGTDSRPGTPAGASTVSNGALRDSLQRDKAVKPRTEPRTKSEGPAHGGNGGETVAGNSNSPMSPQPTDRQGVPLKTPRSLSKQQHQQYSKGQTKVNQFFAPVDGSSRDSDTPSFHQQHREQQQLQQHREPLQPLHLQQASPIEGLIEYKSPSLTPISWPAAGTAAAAPTPASDITAAAPAKSGSKHTSFAAGSDSSGGPSPCHDAAAVQQQLATVEQKHQQELDQLRAEARQREAQLSDQLASSQRQVEQLQTMLQQLHREVAETKVQSDAREHVVQDAVTKLIVQLAQQQMNLTRLQLGIESSSLGTLGIARTGALGFSEVWEDGPVLRELAAKKAALQRAREEVDAARKALKKQLPPPPKATLTADASSNATHDAAGNPYISSEQYVMQDEILKVRLSVLRREEELLSRDEDRLQHEKLKHLRALKRLRDEECSRFQQQPTLHRRYVLVQLLGRGGFSEVHKAYDLQTLKFVAIKIHQLNSTWSEQRKASYVKHSVREYQIHKRLRHPNIVSLTDIFEVRVVFELICQAYVPALLHHWYVVCCIFACMPGSLLLFPLYMTAQGSPDPINAEVCNRAVGTVLDWHDARLRQTNLCVCFVVVG
eukprot:GHUV01017416.1.p1 GENE.GHUV01017416.1~~GHUV01017416.1.p1  ORF type:complete len:751 (+),score=214.00 GHUV01017416.1:207-2459(+)